MSELYHYKSGGTLYGPMPLEQILHYAESGNFGPTTWIKCPSGKWVQWEVLVGDVSASDTESPQSDAVETEQRPIQTIRLDVAGSERQLEAWNALVFGVNPPPGITCWELEELIAQEKKRSYNSPPNVVQRQLAESWGTNLEGIKTQSQARSFFYSFWALRPTVYSILRHAYGARWHTYDESGIDPRTVGAIITELLRDSSLSAEVDEWDVRPGTWDGEDWVTMTKKRQTSAVYAFVVARIGGAPQPNGEIPPPIIDVRVRGRRD